jgi:hypothetical protein
MPDPFGVSAVPGAITAVIKIFEITYQLKAVGEQTQDLLKMTKHAEQNIREARRLRRLKDELFTAAESEWMDNVIADTEEAVRDVAKLIEPSRVDLQTSQSVGFNHRVVWIFKDSAKVQDKHSRLAFYHQSLNTVLVSLINRDVIVVTPAPAAQDQRPPPSYEMSQLFDYRRSIRRKRRNSDESTVQKKAVDEFFDGLEETGSYEETVDRPNKGLGMIQSASRSSESVFTPRNSGAPTRRRAWLAYYGTQSDIGLTGTQFGYKSQ